MNAIYWRNSIAKEKVSARVSGREQDPPNGRRLPVVPGTDPPHPCCCPGKALSWADNNAGAQRYLFSGHFQISGNHCTQLLRAAAPGGIRWVSPLDQGKTTLMRRSLITRWGGPRSETTHNVRGGQVSDWEESQMLAVLAISELPSALQ
jgi:hypothetical protein